MNEFNDIFINNESNDLNILKSIMQNIDMSHETKIATHYQLDDGRIWSIEEAKFVSEVPEDGYVRPCFDQYGKSSEEGLIGCLEFYGYPKGEFKTDDEYAKEVRLERNKRLLETDYLMMPDYPLTTDKINSIKIYRQQLRDISKQDSFPRFVVWPNNPLSELVVS